MIFLFWTVSQVGYRVHMCFFNVVLCFLFFIYVLTGDNIEYDQDQQMESMEGDNSQPQEYDDQQHQYGSNTLRPEIHAWLIDVNFANLRWSMIFDLII